MKKAQTTTVVIIVLLVIIAIGMFYIGFNISDKPIITGNVISDNNLDEIVPDSQYDIPETETTPISNQKVCNDVQVPYQDTETYIESEPYIEQQCQQVNLKYAMLDKECNSDGFLGLNYKVTCNLENQDTEGGNFIMEAGITKWDSPSTKSDLKQNVGGYYYSGETKGYAYVFNGPFLGIATCWCNIVSVPTKQVCTDVTKYHDIQKQRTVTKYRTEQQCN